MPITAATGDVYQVRIVGHIEGQETNNIYYFSSADGDTDVLTHLVVVLVSCFITHLLPVLASAWTLNQAVFKRIYPTLGNEEIYIPPSGNVGGVSTDALPSFVSAVMSIRTAQGGRSHRGRSYLAGMPEAATTGSNITVPSATWTAFLAFAACFASNFIVGDPPGSNAWQQVVFSRKLAGSSHFPVPNVTGFTPVTSYKPVQPLGTTRSRKLGRGA